MAYITIINNETVTCATDSVVILEDDVKQIDEITHLTHQIKELQGSESDRITKSEHKGYQEGYEQGLKQGQEDLNEKFKEYLKGIIEDVSIKSSEIDKIALNLAFEVVRKIVDNIGNDAVIIGIASNAIRKLKQHDSLEIRVNPEYVESLKQSLTNQSDEQVENTRLDIVGDPKLDFLDCVIKTEAGMTIASFEEQLRVIRDHIVKNMKLTA
jgi:flagellar biosynthesis/type III secretory pathway protein FliH